jgi:hypothetical protein
LKGPVQDFVDGVVKLENPVVDFCAGVVGLLARSKPTVNPSVDSKNEFSSKELVESNSIAEAFLVPADK